MTGNERHDQYEELHRHLEDLLSERHPRRTEADTPDDLDLLKMAALLRGNRPDLEGMRPEFRMELEQRLVRELRPAQHDAPSQTRRRFLLGGLAGAAASFLAGITIDRAVGPRPGLSQGIPAIPAPPERELVETNGRWFSVGGAQDIPPGGGQRFRKGAIEGFVVNRDGDYQAYSAVCTHMGCILTYRADQSDLFCPCHGAQFHPNGQIKRGGRTLKPLPRLRVKVEGGEVFVWCMEEMPPSSPT